MKNMQNYKDELIQKINSQAGSMETWARTIWLNPETAFLEYTAANLYREILKSRGWMLQDFRDIDTAFVASFGKAKPCIAFLAEYDALPELGHACGHNISGIAALGAALALQELILEKNISGSIQLIGCPGEESNQRGSGKILLIHEDAFAKLDYALCTHAGGKTELRPIFLARALLELNFQGKAAHATACPEEGINALDAAVLCINAINALRQPSTSDVRLHGILAQGGEQVNVIPEHSQLQFAVRAKDLSSMDKTIEKVLNCGRGAALATACQFKYKFLANNYAELQQNEEILDYFKNNLKYLKEDFSEEAIVYGSSDVGNLSQILPVIQPIIGIKQANLHLHTKEFALACNSSEGLASMLVASKALALTALDLFLKDQIHEE